MIKLRHAQVSLWEGLFAKEVADLWEPWMRVVDELLEDEQLVDAVYQAQGKRHPKSRMLGRQQTPAEGWSRDVSTEPADETPSL